MKIDKLTKEELREWCATEVMNARDNPKIEGMEWIFPSLQKTIKREDYRPDEILEQAMDVAKEHLSKNIREYLNIFVSRNTFEYLKYVDEQDCLQAKDYELSSSNIIKAIYQAKTGNKLEII